MGTGNLNGITNNITVDMCMTDYGRKAMSNGTFSPKKWCAGDAGEIDYRIIRKYGRNIGKEKITKNTPCLEASTSMTSVDDFYPAISSNVKTMVSMPILTAENGTSTTLGTTSLARTNLGTEATQASLRWRQTSKQGLPNTADLADYMYEVRISDPTAIGIQGLVPKSPGTYTVPASSVVTNDGFTAGNVIIFAKAISNTAHDAKADADGTRRDITIKITGTTSRRQIVANIHLK